jgi:hypothetical protein
VWTAGNLTIRNTKVLNGDADKTGELKKKEGNLLNETMDSALGSLAPSSIAGLMCLVVFPIFLISRM